MKKFYTVFMVALVAFFALAACGNPNEPGQDQPDLPGNDTIVTPPTVDQLIQGTWLLDSIIVDTGTDIYRPDINTNRYTRYSNGTFTTGGPTPDLPNVISKGYYTIENGILIMQYLNENNEIVQTNNYSIRHLTDTYLMLRVSTLSEMDDYFFTRIE
ncbi:MAG: hypothetical protein MJZ98_00055 [Paludibacteraceae bacterium]|nr:hypothetical protein [Paludibacteraceae bacterium]